MKTLEIYFTSDVHGYVYPTDYRDITEKPLGMLSVISNITKGENTLIIDGGDVLQGSAFVTYLSDRAGTSEYPSHSIAKVTNKMGYNYVTFGNHEFNYGYDCLKSYMNNINAKCLSTNIVDTTGGIEIFKHDITVLPNGLRVGVMGFSTDFINTWEKKENIKNFTISNTFDSIGETFNFLKQDCDLVIGIYHGGIERDLDKHDYPLLTESTENIACKICDTYDFDILLTGHQHKGIANKNYNKTHIVQTPPYAEKYIHLECMVDDDNNKTIVSELIAPPISPDEELANELNALQDDVISWLDESIGTVDSLLPAPPDENEGKYHKHAQMACDGSLLANFFNQVQLDYYPETDISITAFANSIKGFAKKVVNVRDVINAYVYTNTLVVKKVSGKDLKSALEQSASYLDIVNGEICVSDSFIKPKVAHYNYDYYSNIFYTFDITKPVNSRVVSVVFNGKEILDTDTFNIAMNDYRATGSGGYEFYANSDTVKSDQKEIQNLIIEYIKKQLKDNERNEVIVDKTTYINVIFESSNT